MAYPNIERLSPNRADGPHERRGVLFHHSGMDFAAAIGRMLDPGSRVSYHCLIDRDGTRCTLVPDEKVAWHAGVSTFLGRSNCNDFLLGLSFAGDTYREPLCEQQIESALEWLGTRWSRLGWDSAHMTDHRQVAPGRKDDLNPVEWERLLAVLRRNYPDCAPNHFFPG